MNKEELINSLGFLFDTDCRCNISVFVTTPGSGLKLFNIEKENLGDLLKMFLSSIQTKLIDDEDYVLEDYSSTINRVNTLYRFDLSETERTDEMKNLVAISTLIDPEIFSSDEDSIETINGIYILINGGEQQSISLYKHITNVDKTYTNSRCYWFYKSDDQFKRMMKSLLRITPSFQMFQVNGEIYMNDMQHLEKLLKLDAILRREVSHDITAITTRRIITNNIFLKQACEKPKNCKKLRHALTKSEVITKNIDNATVINFAESKSALKFHFNAEKTMFDIKSKAEAERFIKLLDDDFLRSLLTDTDYDSSDKDLLA